MIPWSSLRSASGLFASTFNSKLGTKVGRRMMGDKMELTPSRWQWRKMKDLLHFYTILGLVPVAAIIFYTNVFIGPATLTEIPEGYTPKHWEYYRHPITRFFARYCFASPQQEYEKYLHLLYQEDEKMKIRQLENKIHTLMAARNDYQAYYYRSISGKHHRIVKRDMEEVGRIAGYDLEVKYK